jgi:hypothetical protein
LGKVRHAETQEERSNTYKTAVRKHEKNNNGKLGTGGR